MMPSTESTRTTSLTPSKGLAVSEPKILVVDDDPGICATFEEALRTLGCSVLSAGDGSSALQAIKQEAFELVFVDYLLPEANGLEILSEVKAFHPQTEVVVITGEGNEQIVRAAFKKGALDYITKPVRLSDLEIIVNSALERQKLRRENRELRRENRSCGALSLERVCGLIDAFGKVMNHHLAIFIGLCPRERMPAAIPRAQ